MVSFPVVRPIKVARFGYFIFITLVTTEKKGGVESVIDDEQNQPKKVSSAIAGCCNEKQFEGQVWERILVSNGSDMLLHLPVRNVLKKREIQIKKRGDA